MDGRTHKIVCQICEAAAREEGKKVRWRGKRLFVDNEEVMMEDRAVSPNLNDSSVTLTQSRVLLPDPEHQKPRATRHANRYIAHRLNNKNYQPNTCNDNVATTVQHQQEQQHQHQEPLQSPVVDLDSDSDTESVSSTIESIKGMVRTFIDNSKEPQPLVEPMPENSVQTKMTLRSSASISNKSGTGSSKAQELQKSFRFGRGEK